MPTDFNEVARTWNTPEKLRRAEALASAIKTSLPLSSTMEVLDYGAGTGLLGFALADAVAHVTLADTAATMLEVARESVAEHADPAKFDVIELDLQDAPAPASYDLIATAMVLHHVPDTAGVLRGFHASLKQGGFVAIADLDDDHHNHFHPDDFDGHRGFDRESLASQMAEAGFDEVRFTTATRILKRNPDRPDDEPREFDVFLATARRP